MVVESVAVPWNGPEPYVGSVEYWSGRDPDRVVLLDADRTMSWAQLDDAADRLAEGLSRLGIRRDDVVAVRTHIRSEWVVIDAALAKLDAQMLGVSWRATAVELEHMLGDSGTRAVICDDADPAECAEVARRAGVTIGVHLGRPARGFTAYADLVGGVTARRIAPAPTRSIVYTSGTTGRPKGVMTRPRPGREVDTVEYFADLAARTPRTPDDTYFATLPFSHGAGQLYTRLALRGGARVLFVERFEAERALDLMRLHGVTCWVTVPTMLHRIAALSPDRLDAKRPTTLRDIAVGAAPVPPSLLDWATGYFGDVVQESYGASEVGMLTHATPEMVATRPGTCGRPNLHVDIEIRGESGTRLPSGESGEIWARTPVAITGYLNRPPMAADDLDVRGFIRTGDVGHLDPDGLLYLTDRAKDMIIRGGVNVYPAVVEAALAGIPDVQEAAVIGVPDDDLGERILAFVELTPSARSGAEDILAAAGRLLSTDRRPQAVEIVSTLPRNVAGKVLKHELRAPYWAGRERAI